MSGTTRASRRPTRAVHPSVHYRNVSVPLKAGQVLVSAKVVEMRFDLSLSDSYYEYISKPYSVMITPRLG